MNRWHEFTVSEMEWLLAGLEMQSWSETAAKCMESELRREIAERRRTEQKP